MSFQRKMGILCRWRFIETETEIEIEIEIEIEWVSRSAAGIV